MARKKRLHWDWHHRRPRSIEIDNSDRNMSHVSVSRHRAWHCLFKNFTPDQIAKIINDIWLDADYVFIVKRKVR